MRCEHCGSTIPNPRLVSSRKLAERIEERLTEYGFAKEMYPHKYQAYTAVRGVIKIHLGELRSKQMSKDEYESALKVLDYILPKGEAENEKHL